MESRMEEASEWRRRIEKLLRRDSNSQFFIIFCSMKNVIFIQILLPFSIFFLQSCRESFFCLKRRKIYRAGEENINDILTISKLSPLCGTELDPKLNWWCLPGNTEWMQEWMFNGFPRSINELPKNSLGPRNDLTVISLARPVVRSRSRQNNSCLLVPIIINS